jgi:SAM-dependent methyltransferase
MELPPEDGLAGTREYIRERGQIDVGAADHHDMGLGIHGIIVIMDLNPTARFSSRVADYIRYRPSYPDGLIPLLERECGLHPEARVADIGSGTGLLSQLFLRFGCEVWGVEPNAEMRLAGERLLAAEPRFRSLQGRAEQTGLPDDSVDFVTAGQAFHWFDAPAARSEFRRILKPLGWVVLVWNERLVEGRFLEEYEALLHRYSADYSQVDHRRMDAGVMDEFFGAGMWRAAALPNEQLFDLEGLMGRLNSSSYAPAAGTEAYDRITEALAKLFAECRQDGVVAFRYETKVYMGQARLRRVE